MDFLSSLFSFLGGEGIPGVAVTSKKGESTPWIFRAFQVSSKYSRGNCPFYDVKKVPPVGTIRGPGAH